MIYSRTSGVHKKAIVAFLHEQVLWNLRARRRQEPEVIPPPLAYRHTNGWINENPSAEYWNKFSISEEEKILADFENSPSKLMFVALHEDRIVGGLDFWGYLAEFVQRSTSFGMSITSPALSRICEQ